MKRTRLGLTVPLALVAMFYCGQHIIFANPNPAQSKLKADSVENDHLHSGPGLDGLGLAGHPHGADLNKAIKDGRAQAVTYLERGMAYQLDTEPDKALADYNQALVIDPYCAKAYIGRSRIYREQGKEAQALAELRKAMKVGTPYEAIDADFDMAYMHREAKRFPQALVEYNNVINSGLLSRTRLAFALMQRGETYLRMGKPDTGIPDLNLALKTDPHQFFAYAVRAAAYTAKGNLQQALADYTSALACEPELHNTIGALDLDMHRLHIYRWRAAIYRRLGRNDLSNKDLRTALRLEHQTIDIAPFSQ